MQYTIQPTKNGKFIVRNPMGNECAKLDSPDEARAWIERQHAQAQQAEAGQAGEERFDSQIPDLNRLQIRWQNWRSWFYSNLTHEDRRLAKARRVADGITDEARFHQREQKLTAEQADQAEAQALYQRAASVDGQIKAARRAKDQDELTRLLADEAEWLIAQMDGFFLSAARPEEYRRPSKPGTKPDTSLALGEERKRWLAEQGGIQPTILRLIDEAMKQ